jgi:hypothetical protein
MSIARAGLRAFIFATLPIALAGCHAPQRDTSDAGPRITLAPDTYPQVFDAARAVLREYRFTLDRVDAQAGIITTTIQPAAGLIAPWEPVQSSAQEEIEDLLHQQGRRVRIDFIDNNTQAVVTVAVERTQSAYLRPSQIVGLTTQAIDPVAQSQGQHGVYSVVVRRDDALATRIARDLQARTSTGQ